MLELATDEEGAILLLVAEKGDLDDQTEGVGGLEDHAEGAAVAAAGVILLLAPEKGDLDAHPDGAAAVTLFTELADEFNFWLEEDDMFELFLIFPCWRTCETQW